MKKTFILISTLLVLLGATACQTTKEIPTNLSAAQLIQNGQNAYGSGDYKLAEKYYQTTIQRYGNNTENYIEAKYELGHLYIKTKDYNKARETFDEIIELYSYDTTHELPASYKKLAQIGLSKIPATKTKANKE